MNFIFINLIGFNMEVLNNALRPKVFCIGNNKTGVTTIESVLSSLGYKMPNQAKQ